MSTLYVDAPTCDTVESSSARRGRLYLYLVPIVLAPLLLLAAAFFIVPTAWFEQRSGNTYLVNLGYGDKLRGRQCDVLVYGDSSAMVGVDPAQVERETGLSACNIAEFEGMTLVNRTLVVDHFLAGNPRPKFIVFLYVPESLSVPRSWVGVSSFEAISYRLEHVRDRSTAWLLLEHPAETFGWAEQGLRMAALRMRAKPPSFEAMHIREATGGQLRYNSPPLKACGDMLRSVPPDPAWIAFLHTHYAVEGTQVFVDATPTADCDRSLPFYRAHLDGLIDNAPYTAWPREVFLDDGRLHANRTGSRMLSAMVAAQVRAHMGQAAPAAGTER